MVDQFELDVIGGAAPGARVEPHEVACRTATDDGTPSVYFTGRINHEPENQAGGQ